MTGSPNIPVESGTSWYGREGLRDYLIPLDTFGQITAEIGDHERIADGLTRYGQLDAVLIDEDQNVVGRGYLLRAARNLGWTHIAARLEAADRAEEVAALGEGQTSLVDLAESAGDHASVAALAPVEQEAAADVDEINAKSSDPNAEWVALPAFVPASDAFRVVVSLESEETRAAFFAANGIRTIHKGTRGTLSVWWPETPRKDLVSLRFEEQEHSAPVASLPDNAPEWERAYWERRNP